MKTTERTTVERVYTSDILPNVQTTLADLGEIIRWADENPVIWKIVTQNKSATFGKGSSTYIGWAQKSDSMSAVLERALTFHRELEKTRANVRDFWRWRARFTLEHYGQKGFRGGFFQQWDGTYDRSCAHLDYTLETREEVIGRFIEWCNSGAWRYEIQAIKIDGEVVRGKL
jgi:hypothetical protein